MTDHRDHELTTARFEEDERRRVAKASTARHGLLAKILDGGVDPAAAMIIHASCIPLPGIIGDVAEAGARFLFRKAIEKICSEGKAPALDGYEIPLKIAVCAAGKRVWLRERWIELLRKSLDPEEDQEIRHDDIAFFNSLNPSDVLFIEVFHKHRELIHEYWLRKSGLRLTNFLVNNRLHPLIADRISRFGVSGSAMHAHLNAVMGSEGGITSDTFNHILFTRSNFSFSNDKPDHAILEVSAIVKNGVLMADGCHQQVDSIVDSEGAFYGMLTPLASHLMALLAPRGK